MVLQLAPQSQQPSEEELARQRRQQAEDTQSWLSWGMNKFSSMGGIFMLGVLLFGAYFLMGTDKGREMVGNVANWLVEKFPGLAGMAGKLGLLPEGVSDAVAADPAAAGRAAAIVQEHGGKVSDGAKAFLQPDVLYDLMTKEPGLVRNIAAKLPKGGTAEDATTKLAMASVRSIINDPARVRTLLSAQHKANTYALLESLSPVPVTPGALGAFIEKTGFVNGQMSPEFLKFLNDMLSDNQKTRNDALVNFAAKNPGAVDQLLGHIEEGKLTDPELRTTVQGLKNLTPGARRAGLAVEANLRQAGTSTDEIFGAFGTVDGIAAMMLNRDMRAKLAPNIDNIGRLAWAQAPKVEGDMRALYQFLGTARTENGVKHAVNIEAMVGLFNDLGSNPGNQGAHEGRTRAVVTGMLGLMTGDQKAANRLNADNISQFFGDPKNVQAFAKFFKTLNPGMLPQDKGHDLRGLVTTLKANWPAMADILDDKASVQALLEKARDPKSGSARPISEMWGVTKFLVTKTSVGRLYDVTQDIADNFEALGKLQKALSDAGVTPTPASQPQRTLRPLPAASVAAHL